MKHLTITDLIKLADGSGHPHLAECPACRERAKKLQGFGAAWQAVRDPDAVRTVFCLTEDELTDVMAGQADPPDATRAHAHMEGCEYCFERAAHYHAEAARMEQADTAPRPPERFLNAAAGLMQADPDQRIAEKTFYQRWIAPAIPAAVAAAVFLLIAFNGGPAYVLHDVKAPRFSLMQQEESGGMPAFFFTGRGEKTGEIPARLKAGMERRHIVFTWDGVENAGDYHFTLEELGGPTVKNVMTIRGEGTATKVPFTALRSGARYRATVAGPLGEGKYFTGEMSFRLEREG